MRFLFFQMPVYSGHKSYPPWVFFEAYSLEADKVGWTDLRKLRHLPLLLKGRALEFWEFNKDAVPFSFGKQTKRPVFDKDDDGVEFYFEHFWDAVQASFLIDFHRQFFGLDFRHWLDWDEVERVAYFLDGPDEDTTMKKFLKSVGSYDREGNFEASSFVLP